MATLLAISAPAADRFPFVVPGDDASPSVTNLAHLNSKPAGEDGFVRIKDGQFHTDSGRLKVWGVNTCFGGNFPTHEEADKAAAHLAKLGVNGLRIHHHDMATTPRGIWARELRDGRRVFDLGQVDKLDYFLAQLHKHGIYVNLNLHVSRTFSEAEGFLTEDLPRDVRYNKYVLYYMPRMRELFKEFCRVYLLHENPYRKLRRIDDPGIAMLEITNENAFSTKGPGIAASLPDPYRSEFRKHWNAWLARRYVTTGALKKAWKASSEPLGDDLGDMGDVGKALDPWHLRQDAGCPVEAVFGQPGPEAGVAALKLDIITQTPDTFRQELMLRDLSVEEGKLYTISFWVRADAERSVYVDVSNQGPDNWRPVGYRQTLRIGPEWLRVQHAFRARETLENNARVCMKLGGSDVALYLAGVRLRTGGEFVVLPEGQSIESANVEIPVQGWAEEARHDARAFMGEVETGFIREVSGFLKDELGAKVPITASQITYHGARIVADTCDYADIHGYWQHPRFPGKPWDRGNWLIGNTPMEQKPGEDTLLGRAVWRLVDRPYTISEWNIPDPHDFAASVVPFGAMVAALQDWDGVFFFQYHSSEKDWFGDSITGYFSFNRQPAKLALLTACANLYRRGDLAPLAESASGTVTQLLDPAAAMQCRVGIDPNAPETTAVELPQGKRLASPDGSVVWDAGEPGQAAVTVNTPATRAVWGLVAGRTFELGNLTFGVGEAERDYAVIVLTSLDGRPVETSERMLLAAVGSAQNLGMKWNEDRTSVGREWGRGPTQVNGIPVTIRLPARGSCAVFALDGCGNRTVSVPVRSRNRFAEIAIGPQYRTLWYEIEAN